MADRESSAVGFRLRGFAPPDLSTYPDRVKLLFWGWVTDSALKVKDRELSRGWDKDGNVHPLRPKTIKYRKSEVGPVTKTAPRLEPALKRSRVRALLRGRAHLQSSELFWDFDAVSGDSFAAILHHAADAGHDVFGISDRGMAQIRREALAQWQSWKIQAGHARPAVNVPGGSPVSKREVKKPISKREVKGRMDLENFTLSSDGDKLRAAIEAGQFSGFRRLNAKGEQWKPGTGIPKAQRKPVPRAPGPTPRPVPRPLPTPAPVSETIPVSAAMDIQAESPRIGRHAKAVFEAIDKVHSDGNLPKIPVMSNKNPDYEGFISVDPKTGKPERMEINRAADHPHITIAHETGHVLDYAGIPRTAPQIGIQRDFRKEELFKEFVAAFDNSESIKTLRSRQLEEKLGDYPLDQHHIAYLLQDHEIWARAYSQWVVVKSGELDMAAQLEHMLIQSKQKIYAHQWTADDFTPIAVAIDDVFRKLGWLK